MNAPHRPGPVAPTKYRLTGEDVLGMQEAGILPRNHRCELIHGELIEMPSEGDLHSYWKGRLTFHMTRLVPADWMVGPDTTLRLADYDWPEPDLFFHSANLRPADVRGQDIFLMIEVSNSSLAYDLNEKAELYRTFGIREYWIVDVNARATHVHRLKSDGVWDEIKIVPFHEPIVPLLLPDAAIRLADWG